MISKRVIKHVFAQVDQMRDELVEFVCDLGEFPQKIRRAKIIPSAPSSSEAS